MGKEYLGIKDKNGKEICKGDIVMWKVKESPMYLEFPVFHKQNSEYGFKGIIKEEDLEVKK